MKTTRIVRLDVTVGDYKSYIASIVDLALCRLSSYVCVANVHMFVEVWKNAVYTNVVNSADIITPDGKPLSKAIEWLYGIKQPRVAGMDLFPDLLREAEASGLGVYLYGSTDEVLGAIQNKSLNDYPRLIFSGAYSPPFRALTDVEKAEDIRRINESGAHLVFVALGCPKQERWMAENKGKIHAVMLGVGGAFPVYAGLQKRAPEWMQKYALEWMFRLYQEPKRMWKRYLVTNTLFCILLAKELFKVKIWNRL